MGPLTEVARRWRKEKLERQIRAEADKRPPRIVRVPAITPIPQPFERMKPNGDVWRLIELNRPPEHRVTMVPILPPPDMARVLRNQDDVLNLTTRLSEDAQFQAVEYWMEFQQLGGGTRVRWWGYEHVGEARTKYRGLNRTAAYAERIRYAFDQIFGPRERPREPDIWETLMRSHLPFPVETLREWVELVLEDVEQALGKP